MENSNQPYFAFDKNGEQILISMTEILTCIGIAEKEGEIPPLDAYFWHIAEEKYGVAPRNIVLD